MNIFVHVIYPFLSTKSRPFGLTVFTVCIPKLIAAANAKFAQVFTNNMMQASAREIAFKI